MSRKEMIPSRSRCLSTCNLLILYTGQNTESQIDAVRQRDNLKYTPISFRIPYLSETEIFKSHFHWAGGTWPAWPVPVWLPCQPKRRPDNTRKPRFAHLHLASHLQRPAGATDSNPEQATGNPESQPWCRRTIPTPVRITGSSETDGPLLLLRGHNERTMDTDSLITMTAELRPFTPRCGCVSWPAWPAVSALRPTGPVQMRPAGPGRAGSAVKLGSMCRKHHAVGRRA